MSAWIDQHLRRVRPGAVVPVGEGDGQGRAGLEAQVPEVGALQPPGPEGEPSGRGRVVGFGRGSREDVPPGPRVPSGAMAGA